MRVVGLALIVLPACAFNPTLDGQALLGCHTDADCVRGGRCVDSACVSRPFSVLSFAATPPSVEAGEACSFAVEVAEPERPRRLGYAWRQARGPTVEVRGEGPTAELTTLPDFVGSYALEVTVSNGRDPPVSARAACVALVSADAAFVVPGMTGDCSRQTPCGALTEVGAARRIYVGGNPDFGPVAQLDAPRLDNELDGRELHGGFVFPGWTREPPRMRTALAGWFEALDVTCTDCVVTGLYHRRVFANSDYQHALVVGGDRVTLREVEVVVAGGGGSFGGFGISLESGVAGIVLDGVDLRVDPMGLRGRWFEPVRISGGAATIRDSVFDISPAEVLDKTLLTALGPPLVSETIRLERTRWVGGTGATVVEGLRFDCMAAEVVNTIVDVRGPGSGSSVALRDYGWDAPCPPSPWVHSSLLLAGHGATSVAVSLTGSERSLRLINSILDGGQGDERRIIEIAWQAALPAGAHALDGTVLVLSGGERPDDAWVRDNSVAVALEDVAQTYGLAEEPRTTTVVGHANPAVGDFRLTPASTCCIATGRPWQDGDPRDDLDRLPRPLPPARPSTGPHQAQP